MNAVSNGRIAWALLLAVVAAGVVFVVTTSVTAAVVTIVGGLACSLIAAGPGDPDKAEAPSAPPAPSSPLGEVLDGIVEPVLIIRNARVALANHAARSLLGMHIVGEDVRVALRHPAAAERLATPEAPLPERPIDLVGLGSLEQRWQMRVAETSDGARVVHLIDQTGNYAAEKMRVDFVANASHELRTPLASILGYVETLSDEAGEDADVRARFLKVMWDEARRMQRLVEDLISLSRIEAEKYRAPSEPVNLAQLTRDVCAELKRAGSKRAEDVSCEAAGDVPTVSADRVQLSQVLHNLIGNAMKYGKAGTPVLVRLSAEQHGMVRLSVADEGEGIPTDHIPRLTERFYRVDAGRSRALGGTGLGLAIVKHIVERHRGRLDIASRVGVGTTVSVTLPATQRPQDSVS